MATRIEGNVRQYRQLLDAFNRHDAEAGAGMYQEAAVVTDHGQHETFSGREAIRRSYWQGWFDASSDQQMEEVDVIGAEDWTVTRGVIRGRHDGPWGDLLSTHRPFEASVCDLVRWQDGKVVEEHLYYDLHTILVQLGQASK